jgi:hypothetical protein
MYGSGWHGQDWRSDLKNQEQGPHDQSEVRDSNNIYSGNSHERREEYEDDLTSGFLDASSNQQ